MKFSLAFLGPSGTYAEAAALVCSQWWKQHMAMVPELVPYPSIAQTLQAVVQKDTQLAIVPVENSTEGSVTTTLDTLWQLNGLQIQQAWVLPISHALISRAEDMTQIQAVYSHPQALAQCQGWLERHVPGVRLIPTQSTTEALQHLTEPSTGAIASCRAAELYNLPVLAHPINDRPDNCTRFWVLGLDTASDGLLPHPPSTECATNQAIRASHTSLAFSLPANVPGALLRPLEIFARRGINMSRIESRPTKRSLGEYLFFVDIEATLADASTLSMLEDLTSHTETLKIFGSYSILQVRDFMLSAQEIQERVEHHKSESTK